MTGHYTKIVRERRSVAWAVLATGLVMLALLADRGAPVWTWALVAPCIAICILQIALKPGYGIGLTSRDMTIFDGFSERRLPIHRVDHLRLSKTSATLVLRSGDEVALPRHVMRNTLPLIREATARGIPVRAL
ncbi:MAG: hypothetical protein R6U99_14590 [Nioella sp.]